jgi:hypothetical protein
VTVMSTTSVPATTISSPRRQPESTCQWWGDSNCRANSNVNLDDVDATCSGSGGQGGGQCTTKVE